MLIDVIGTIYTDVSDPYFHHLCLAVSLAAMPFFRLFGLFFVLLFFC